MPGLELAKDAVHQHKLTTLTATAAIDDVFASDDAVKPISGGVFTVTAGDDLLKYTYHYDEVRRDVPSPRPPARRELMCRTLFVYQLKVILEGTIVLEDADSGNKLEATAGDIINIKKGTTVIFSSPDAGRAFYVGQRKLRDF
ncbi:hypothetical protein JCM3775_006186 [Rhodotorula graminis]